MIDTLNIRYVISIQKIMKRDIGSEIEYDLAEDPSTVTYEYRYGCNNCGQLGHAMRKCSN